MKGLIIHWKIQDISKDYPNFIFMDENKMGKHDYTSKMAYDDDHLGTLGAEKLTHRLDSLIKTLDTKSQNKKEKWFALPFFTYKTK